MGPDPHRADADADADAAGDLDWWVSVDSTVCRVHQHGAALTREVSSEVPSHTGGSVE